VLFIYHLSYPSIVLNANDDSSVALERATTAREAIQIMGDLATSEGFYAADWSGGQLSMGEGGEGLTVIDKNEAWIFHVLGDDTGASAVWAAQRIPDNHVSGTPWDARPRCVSLWVMIRDIYMALFV
jgi:dipeptidase